MCDKAVDDFLPALKFVPDGFVTSKILKNFIMLYSQMMVHSFLIKILLKLHFLVMKWAFLVKTLITLILMLILDLWLGTINLNNVKHLKKI